MAYTKEKLDSIFKKTDGSCHLCRKKLARKNYGAIGARMAWEVDHSRPRAHGGSDHGNNLLPACIPCNREKRAISTRAARRARGYKAAPLSRQQKTQNAWVGAAGGAIAARIALAPLGPLGMLGGAVLGAALGNNYEPE